MKKITLLLLLFVNIGIAQNREETIDWLNRNLSEYAAPGTEKYNIKIINDENYGEMIVIDVLFTPLNIKKFYSFKPNAITRVATTRKLRSDKINGNLDIEVVSKNKSIWTSDEKFIDSFDFWIQASNENVEKINRGFLHLLELMGNKIAEEKDYFSH